MWIIALTLGVGVGRVYTTFVIRPQASEKSIFSLFLLALTLYAGFILIGGEALAVNANAAVSTAEGPRYFVKTANPFWQRSFGVRHFFDDGFTTDLSGIQVALARLFGVEVEPVLQLHVSPDGNVEVRGNAAKARPLPNDQTPWGIQLIYNDSTISRTSGGAGVNVAVLDTGVLKTHSDLKNRIKQCKDFTQIKTPIKDGACDDKNGHGTHVSGIILADGGADGLGIFGVAPEANLFSYKVCGNDGSCWADDIAAAMKTAADNRVNIINMSLGSDSDSSFIRDAVSYAVSKDVLVAAAGGNDGPYPLSIDYPAANSEVIGVGAIDISVSVPDWSSRGGNFNTKPYFVEEKDIEFGAPGVGVESAWKNGGYAVLSGTSMASPHLAGLAAKVWQSLAFEGTRALATRDLLHQLGKDIWSFGDDDATGFGLPQLVK